MGKRKRLLLAVGCAVLALVLAFTLTRKHEPTANGKPLSYWAEIYRSVNPPAGRLLTPEAQAEAGAAIKQIGTNAISFLLKGMDYEPPQWKSKLSMKTDNLPSWIVDNRLAKWFFAAPSLPTGWSAAGAFRALGPAATPAIHELEVRAESNSKEKRAQALYALSHLGPMAAPAIVRVFSNPDRVAYAWIRPSIPEWGTNARPLVPRLVQYMDHTNADAVAASARILGDLRLEPDLVIPALMRKLTDPRPVVSQQIPFALASFGPPALTQLTNALSDPDPLVRQSATNAIARINFQHVYPGPSSTFE
jgi:hypothetical protein